MNDEFVTGARFIIRLLFEMDGAAREKRKPFLGFEVFPFILVYVFNTAVYKRQEQRSRKILYLHLILQILFFVVPVSFQNIVRVGTLF